MRALIVMFLAALLTGCCVGGYPPMWSADPLVGGLRIREDGERGFELGVPPSQRIVGRVGNRRRIFAVIAPVMLGDFLAQARMFGAGGFQRGGLGRGVFGRRLFRGHRKCLSQAWR